MKSSTRAQIRKRSGLTQIRLARLTGVSQARLSSWENYDVELSPQEVRRVARVLQECLTRSPAFDGATDLALALAPPAFAAGQDQGRTR
jgi:transcriptional regulator with XRE-family HTH domain